MDLGAIRKKLEDGEYSGAEKLRHDFDLMIASCKGFYGGGGHWGEPCCVVGRVLEWDLEEVWSRCVRLGAFGNQP